MNYGYNANCKGWKENKKQELAKELSKELEYPIGYPMGKANDGSSPYIEIDDFYDGVRIRRITWLSDEEKKELVKKADKIYNKLMGND